MALYAPGKLLISPSVVKASTKDAPIYLLPNQTALDIFSSQREIPEEMLIKWCLSDLMPKGKNFVDVGAHVGTWTMWFARSKKCAHVYSFECQKQTFECLCANLVLNGVSDKVSVERVAITSPEKSETNVELKIISADGGGSSTVSLPTNQDPLSKENVGAATLDSFDIENIGLIKIDVEGAELDVLRGATETLSKNGYPKIIFEAWDYDWYKDQKKELFDFLEKLGYGIHSINGFAYMFLADKPKEYKKSEEP
jgi:FkbM family methyltransferase